MTSSDPSADPSPEIGRLQATFMTPYTTHPSKWDLLWKESYTPWDRGGPSTALADLLTQSLQQSQELLPRPHGRKPRALVPGCGRGHDVLLVSAFGYDVTGLDVSSSSIASAIENEKIHGQDGIYAPREGVEKGEVTWLAGDFFGDALQPGSFDLIYDYTFFCALPPEARHRWASRMSQLLAPDGRLVCLEWPLHKGFPLGGPPWGVTPETYVGHLRHPGMELEYDAAGLVLHSVPETPSPDALHRLAHVKPTRTHKSGYDEAGNIIDFISVWSRAS